MALRGFFGGAVALPRDGRFLCFVRIEVFIGAVCCRLFIGVITGSVVAFGTARASLLFQGLEPEGTPKGAVFPKLRIGLHGGDETSALVAKTHCLGSARRNSAAIILLHQLHALFVIHEFLYIGLNGFQGQVAERFIRCILAPT